MNISELNPGQKVTILAATGDEKIEFETTVDDLQGDRETVYIKPIYKDDKLMGFKAKGVQVHLIVPFQNMKPQVFRNVSISTVRYEKDGRICYAVSTPEKSVEVNRRGAFRCYIGVDSMIRVGRDKEPMETTIKDVSATGFAFIVRGNENCENGQLAHAVLNDRFEDEDKKLSFHLSGQIVNSRELENGNKIYGCRFLDKCPGLENYIAKKERLRLQKERGNFRVNMNTRREGA